MPRHQETEDHQENEGPEHQMVNPPPIDILEQEPNYHPPSDARHGENSEHPRQGAMVHIGLLSKSNLLVTNHALDGIRTHDPLV